MDPQKITELAKLLRDKGDKILNSEFTFTLSGSLLRALNDSFTLITETSEIGNGQQQQIFQVLKPMQTKSPVFRELQLIYDFVQKTTLLCIVQYPGEECFDGIIDISKFRALERLEVQKINVRQIVGIHRLRAQLQHLICVKSLRNVEEIITHCGGDRSNGFVWNELKVADFSFNNLQTVDTSLEFAQYLQHLNLRHNQLQSVQAIKWLPHLKTLDLSFNRLLCIPQFHVEAYKRLQSLNMSNNFVEDLMGSAKLDALTDLDLSDNFLLDHTYLYPLSQLMTLKYLNLYGNPLHCHPKHRLVTAQYLHKNTATVKFILDFEPLSKSEKAATGSKQIRHVGAALNRFSSKSSAASINSGNCQSSSASQTPSSSFGSIRSFLWQQDASYTEAETAAATPEILSNGKKSHFATKVRTVDIVDNQEQHNEIDESGLMNTNLTMGSTEEEPSSNVLVQSMLDETSYDHLEAKRQVETLREKYGAEWLQSGNAEMINSVLGIESTSDDTQLNNIMERSAARQQFEDYLGDFGATTSLTIHAVNSNKEASNEAACISTPANQQLTDNVETSEHSLSSNKSPNLSNNEKSNESNNNNIYMSKENNQIKQYVHDSVSESATHNSIPNAEHAKIDKESGIDENAHGQEEDYLKNIYSEKYYDEPEISETEPDEETYIVISTGSRNDTIFLTLSSNFLRERDTLTQQTNTKWSLKILESCERLKSNTLRINFDTVKKDKQERVYEVADNLCQELENKLRNILSERDLSEMNQTIYRCVNCMCQFSHENKHNKTGMDQDIRCPDCKSTFVAEVHENPKDHSNIVTSSKLSPASIVEEMPTSSSLLMAQAKDTDDTASIGSVNSLNESSSCSKITNSQSSFDSNQSVAGSSNTERENELLRGNYESDVEILSNPSQSSIEVLDSHQHRSSDEERFETQLGTVMDMVASAPETSKKTGSIVGVPLSSTTQTSTMLGPLAHFNLTESSSSGSVTDSICTAYEQAAVENRTNGRSITGELSRTVTPDKNIIQSMLAAESGNSSRITKGGGKSVKSRTSKEAGVKDTSVSSMFGAIFQSTNMLMSSSRKMLETEANIGVPVSASSPIATTKTITKCVPYKFNYSDFNDIDHRLKLYFYQTKFEEAGESFKWLVRGRILNETTSTLSDGIVVVSTCKLYLMEVIAPEHDDVTQWLKHIVSVTIDRLEAIQLLPWKLGLSFTLRGWGDFLLILQDILRTDSLLLHFANDGLPAQCQLQYQVAPQIQERLSTAVSGEPLKMCSILNSCNVSCETARRRFTHCALLTTDTCLYLTSSSQLGWLSQHAQNAGDIDTDVIQVCMTQYMSNLVAVELFGTTDCGFTINFLDETENKSELWKCTFETKDNAESCLNAIGQSWQELFGVPLNNAS